LIYNNLSRVHQADLQEIRNKFGARKISKDTLESSINSHQIEHRNRMNQLRSIIRTLSSQMSHTDRCNLAKHTSGFSKYNEDVTALGNSYAATVLPEETVLSAVDLVEDAIDFLGYQIVGSAKEIEKAELHVGKIVEVSGGRLLP